ncbi:MAG: hypothetical protein QM477_08350 [Planctomycetota bacterium]
MLFAALGGVSCSTLVSPEAIMESPELSDEAKTDAIERWESAVERANAFLLSDSNTLMPRGSYELLGSGLVYRTDKQDWEVTIRNTWFGDVVVATGFIAQERSWGFVVGEVGKGEDLIANSLFRTSLDEPRSADDMANLILHETAHQVFDVGTLDFLGTMHYYWYSLFDSHSKHPDEQDPNAVSAEFTKFTVQ